MIHVQRLEDSSPTVLLDQALTALQVASRTTHGLTLLIVPRSTLDPSQQTRDAWYDAHWAIEGVCDHIGSTELPHLCPLGPEEIEEEGAPKPWPAHLSWYRLAHVTTISHALLIPEEVRLAAAPPASIDGWDADQLRFLGGPQRAMSYAERARQTTVRNDRSADIYDWHEMALRIATLYSSLQPPKPTPLQRVIAGGANLLRARAEVERASRSQAALVRNAQSAGDGIKAQWSRFSGVSRPTIDAWLGGTTTQESEPEAKA